MPSKFNPELEKLVHESLGKVDEKLPEGHHAHTIVRSALQMLLIEGRDKKEVGHLIALVTKIRDELEGVAKPDEIELGVLGEMGLAAIREAKRLHT